MDNTGFLPNSAWGFSKILSSEKEMQLKTALPGKISSTRQQITNIPVQMRFLPENYS